MCIRDRSTCRSPKPRSRWACSLDGPMRPRLGPAAHGRQDPRSVTHTHTLKVGECERSLVIP
eukprot:512421-Alexandrium_andersonii.AAC.1